MDDLNSQHRIVQHQTLGPQRPTPALTEQRESNDPEWCLLHNQSTAACSTTEEDYDSHECMFERCREWLDECLQVQSPTSKHSGCSKPLAGGKFSSICPNRLIDVGNDSLKPRLVKFNSMEQIRAASAKARYPGYVTLSYCWGVNNDKEHLLREENENDFMTAIPRLPKTLDEALKVCQRLGVKYIWIDAICIIQGHDDNSSDWEWQSARVGSYYANSLFTIAAAWATANDQGCLPVRSYDADDDHRLPMAPWRCPLIRRGWVMQELSLTIRTLWMFDGYAEWSCSEGAFSYTRLKPYISTFQLVQRNLRQRWYSLLSDYTATDLTFSEDRLPAMSGICKYVDPDNKEQYLAGIWQQSMSEGLLWRQDKPGPLADNMPSWSPLSNIKGRVYFFLEHIDNGYHCELHEDCAFCGPGKLNILDTEVDLRYGDRHGKIWSARIVAEASIYHIDADRLQTYSELCLADEHVTIYGDRYLDPAYRRESLVDAMLVCHGIYDGAVEPSTQRLCLFFLLLSRVKDDTYRRVGVFASARLDRSGPAVAQIRARRGTRRLVLI